MAVAAERSRDLPSREQNNSVDFTLVQSTITQWLVQRAEDFILFGKTLENLPQRLRYILNDHERSRLYQFNIPIFAQRWLEFSKTGETRDQSWERFRKLIDSEIESYTREYILRMKRDRFDLFLTSDDKGNLLSTEYIPSLLPMAESAVQRFIHEGKPSDRMEADAIAISKMIDWAKHAPNGAMGINISPPGRDYLGPSKYAFAFLRQIETLPDGKRIIHTEQLKLWLDYSNLAHLLVSLGVQLPQGFRATELNLSQGFFQLPHNVSLDQLEAHAQQLPQKRVPEEYKEVILHHPQFFQQEFHKAKEFFLNTIEQYFPPYTEAGTTRQKKQSLEAMEVAFNMVHRRLQQIVKLDQQGETAPTDLGEMADFYQKYINHIHHGQRLNPEEIVETAAIMTDFLGPLRSIGSWGQCLGGSIFSLQLDGGLHIPLESQLYKGIPIGLLQKEASGFHFENCPICKDKTMVLEMPNGDQVCSGCKTKKLCGNEKGAHHNHAKKHIPTKDHHTQHNNQESAHRSPSHQSYSKRLHQEMSSNGTTRDAVNSLLTSVILGFA